MVDRGSAEISANLAIMSSGAVIGSSATWFRMACSPDSGMLPVARMICGVTCDLGRLSGALVGVQAWCAVFSQGCFRSFS